MEEKDFHTKTIKLHDIKSLTRKVLDVEIPGTLYGQWECYQMRRSMADDSGILLKLLGDDEEGLPYTILKRYSRKDEWKIIQELSTKMFMHLGVIRPDYVWPDYSKKKTLKDDNQKKSVTGLGALFG